MRKFIIIILLALITTVPLHAQKILIPMDLKQTDHLKAYGVAFWTLTRGLTVEWILNYRGGSFIVDHYPMVEKELRIRGVAFTLLDGSGVAQIYATIEENNMENVLLEKAPTIAVYTPPNSQPWDDAVTLALEYAEVPYDKIWDEEVLIYQLDKYDWLHLHHEDFTGQYGKFYAAYRNTPWYIKQQLMYEEHAKKFGFSKVSQNKGTVARIIKEYVVNGGFLFAMCSATDTFDLSLAAFKTDICETPFDGDPLDPDYKSKLDYSQTFAFEKFILVTDPMVYEFSDIDIPSTGTTLSLRGADADYFTLFDFSAKYDPVPTMLTQNHVNVVKGFMGQTTGFRRDKIKKFITILGEAEGTDQVKYLHGNIGRGTITFYGGHDPEDYTHAVGDPPTDLSLHKNSPGYRLILNNILFPAAKKKKKKT